MKSAGAKTRAAAAEVVDAVVNGRSLDAAIAVHETQLPPGDRSLLRMLSYGVVRNHFRLQEWIDQLVSRPFRRRDSVVNALLAVGLFQLCDTRIPDHAAVSQTVEATRQLRQLLNGSLNSLKNRR